MNNCCWETHHATCDQKSDADIELLQKEAPMEHQCPSSIGDIDYHYSSTQNPSWGQTSTDLALGKTHGLTQRGSQQGTDGVGHAARTTPNPPTKGWGSYLGHARNLGVNQSIFLFTFCSWFDIRIKGLATWWYCLYLISDYVSTDW